MGDERTPKDYCLSMGDPVAAVLKGVVGGHITEMVAYPGWRWRYDESAHVWIHERIIFDVAVLDSD